MFDHTGYDGGRELVALQDVGEGPLRRGDHRAVERAGHRDGPGDQALVLQLSSRQPRPQGWVRRSLPVRVRCSWR